MRIASGSALVQDCLIAWNRQIAYADAREGAGVTMSGGTLRNCTVTGNTALNQPTAGVLRTGGSVVNCVISGNFTELSSGLNPQVSTTTGFTYSCAPELTTGTGNTPLDPSFANPAAGNFRLAAASPCLNVGLNTGVSSTDLDGNARIAQTTVDMGAFEKDAASGPLECDFAGDLLRAFDAASVHFTADLAGDPANTVVANYAWDFGDGQSAIVAAPGSTAHDYDAGVFTVTLTVTNSLGAVASRSKTSYVSVYPSTVYLSKTGNSAAPYKTPLDAATNIVDAVATAGVVGGLGSTVLIADGEYGVTSELFLNKGIRLRSVNGPTKSSLYRIGTQVVGQPEYRVLRIGSPDAVVDGLTVSNGFGRLITGLGVYMHAGVLTNCHVRLNKIPEVSNPPNHLQGAGIYMLGGLVTHCLIADNWLWHEQARGGGVNMEGGGILRNSVIRNNLLRGSTYERGSGVYLKGTSSIVENCLVVSNVTIATANRTDGPAIHVESGVLRNTTVSGNSATNNTVCGIYRSGGSVTNCIAYGNVAVRGDSQQAQVGGSVALPTGFAYSCAPELTSGTGNITADPLFRGAATGDYRLSTGSLAINAGIYQPAWMDGSTDLDGFPRVKDNVDMGCYEVQPPGGTVIVVR